MATITKVHSREILDARGNPTLEAEVTQSDGSLGHAAMPRGVSKVGTLRKTLLELDRVAKKAGFLEC